MPELMSLVRSTDVPTGAVGIWWIGQAGYIFKTSSGKVIFIDAYLSGALDGPPEAWPRRYPPPIQPEEVECDLFIATHNHSDHNDLEAIRRMDWDRIGAFLGPRNVIRALRGIGVPEGKLVLCDAGDTAVAAGLKLLATFCIPNDAEALDSAGYLITTEDGLRLYHTGDTGFHRFLYYMAAHPIDVMFVCINGKLGNMGGDEAAELARYLRPKLVVPNHYDMFARNMADQWEFLGRLNATGVEPPAKVLEVGETFVYRMDVAKA
jgi:L-ascorbate 6-phosphate lactonase